MKQLLLIAVCTSFLGSSSLVFAQAGVDDLLNNPVNINMIGNASNLLVDPVDLDFNQDEGRENELWVLNQGYDRGGTTVTFYDPGTPDQTSVRLVDGNGWHFMAHAAALAFGDNETWGTAQNIIDANRSGRNFIWAGPSMWSTDLDIHAVDHGRNGSHLDMIHMSPNSSGMAHEVDNVFWVFDGVFGDVLRCDLAEPHEPGGDFHGDALVRRYTGFELEHNGDIPCHMIMDENRKWLYIVDGGNQRIVRLDITTGAVAQNLPLLNPEQLAEYSEVRGATWEVYIDNGLEMPSGIDYKDGRLLVGDNATGEIVIYDATGESAVEMGRIQTGATSLMGIVVSPDDNIFFVDYDRAAVGQVVLAQEFDVQMAETTHVIPSAGATIEYTIENMSDVEMTFTAEIGRTFVSTPSQWSVAAAAGTVAAGTSETFEITLDVSAVASMGQYALSISVDGQPTIAPKTQLVTVISEDVDLVTVNDVTNTNRNNATLDPFSNIRPSAIELSGQQAQKIIPMLPNLKTVVWNAGAFGSVTQRDADLLEATMLGGVNVLFMGDGSTIELANGTNADLLDLFGAELVGGIRAGFTTGGAISLSGVPGDPVSSALGTFGGTLTIYNDDGRMAGIPSPALNATSLSSRPFIHYEDAPDSAIAVRFIGDGYRSAIVALNPTNINERSVRNTLLREAIEWLESSEADGTPAISVSATGIDFGFVPVGARRTRSLTIENTGDGILDVFALNISNGVTVFEFDEDLVVPFFIAPGEDLELELTFRPTTAEPVTETLTILSNGGDDVVVDLAGNVVASVTPRDGNSDELSIQLGPNPISASGTINYAVRGAAKPLTIEVLDASGRIVQRLLQSTVAPGEYQLELDVSNLADGNYFLIMSSNTEAVYTRLTRIR